MLFLLKKIVSNVPSIGNVEVKELAIQGRTKVVFGLTTMND